MSEPNIDEGFYSRQLLVLGREAMGLMKTSRVLIAGMKGLGVELAKNVVLFGVKGVTVQDEGVTEVKDLSSQFFLNPSHLGQNRASCTVEHLSALNRDVRVTAHTEPLSKDLMLKHKVVVLTDSSLEDQKFFGEFCHQNGIKFIVADTRGLCGQLFCDFGQKLVVQDPDGIPPASALIQSISQGNPGVVVCVDEHGFNKDSMVKFSQVQGMTELNGASATTITVLDDNSFSIGDTSSFSKYTAGGAVTAVKEPITLHFVPITEALLKRPNSDQNPRDQTLHLAFQALHRFEKESRRLPRPWSQEDADLLLRMVLEMKDPKGPDRPDEDVVRLLSFTARGDLAPINAVIGGMAAQEVIKACSGKFTPVRQWFYFSALECLPEDTIGSDPPSPSLEGTRYDGQVAVFGSDFQEKLGRQKYFLVGAGAIGCELLKNFALMGLGAGEDGRVTVTDMDLIEKSNLNRQFLFHHQDIGKPKSDVAAAAVRAMNPQVNITAHQNRLDPDSEAVYDHRFFSALDGAVAALDNVEAREYLDGLCLKYKKPLLEGGTEGTKGHTLVVVPHLTQSYGRGGSGSDDDIPLCTLKNFPIRIEHTLQWARDQFEGLFKQTPENVNLFIGDPGFMEKTLRLNDSEALETLAGVWTNLSGLQAGGKRPASWDNCIQWAREKWQTLYHDDLVQLLHFFPPEALTASGVPFWSGSKKCPHPLTFDPDESTHLDFVVAAANLFAHVHNIPGSSDRPSIRRTLQEIHVPPFTPSSSVKIHLTDKEMEEEREKESDDRGKARLEELRANLEHARPSALQMRPIDFEKDDDTNFHMDSVVAASNLRAENYDIPAADRLTSKAIAGRIIPAIATTTAVVAGLMCLELYKLVQGHRNIRSYRVAFLNLGRPNFVSATPGRASGFEVAGKKFSEWDDFLVEGSSGAGQEMTLEDLLRRIKDDCGLNVCMLAYGSAIVFDTDEKTHQQSLSLTVSEVVRTRTGTEIPAHKKILDLSPVFEEDQVSERVPWIRFLLP